MKKRLFSLMLCVIMVTALLPFGAQADDPKSVAFPITSAYKQAFAYTGEEQVFFTMPSENVRYYWDSGVLSATDCGKYTVTFALKQSAIQSGYTWSNGKTDPETYEWYIYNPVEITIYGYYFGYSGQEQCPVKVSATAIPAGKAAEKPYYTYETYWAGTNTLVTGTTKNGAIEEGAYCTVVTLNTEDFPDNRWAIDGSVTEKRIYWNIGTKYVAEPAITTELTYNGEAQLPFDYDPNGPYKISGVYSATDAGSYTFYLKPKEGYVWLESGDNSGRTYNWKISPASVTVPTAKTTLTYNGDTQTGVIIPDGAALESGTVKAIDAGAYSCTLKLISDNYSWNVAGIAEKTTAKTIEWSIARKPVTLPENIVLEYTGSAIKCPFVNCDEYRVKGDTTAQSDLGVYTCTLTPTANYCWDIVDDPETVSNERNTAKTVKWTISEKVIAVRLNPNAALNGEGVYELKEMTSETDSTKLQEQKLVLEAADDHYTVSNNDGHTNAKDTLYSVYVTPESGYCWSNGKTDTITLTWKVVHDYQYYQTSNGTQHYQVCAVCGSKTEEKNHTAVEDGEYVSDAVSHWKLCACGKIVNVASHEFDSDHKCKICGYQGTHTYAAEYTSDALNHWKVCSCGGVDESTVAPHDFSKNSHTCSICGYTKTEYQHRFVIVDDEGKTVASFIEGSVNAEGTFVPKGYISGEGFSIVPNASDIPYVVQGQFSAWKHYMLDTRKTHDNLTGTFSNADITTTLYVTRKECNITTKYTWELNEATNEWSCTATHACEYDNCPYVTAVTETATVANKGIQNRTTATCTIAGENYVEATFSEENAFFTRQTRVTGTQAALGHIWATDAEGKDLYTIDTYATATQDGALSVHCTRCNAKNPEKTKTYKNTDTGALVRVSGTSDAVDVDVTVSGTTAAVTLNTERVKDTDTVNVTVPVGTLSFATKVNTITFSYDEVKKLIDAKVNSVALSVYSVAMALDNAALNKLFEQMTAGDTLSFVLLINPTLTTTQLSTAQALPNATAVEIIVKCGSKTVDYIGAGNVIVTIPFTMEGDVQLKAAILETNGTLSETAASYASSRATMSVACYRTYVLYTTEPAYVLPFTDVTAADWFYEDVVQATQMKLIDGKSATKFDPAGNLKICEAIKLAACMNQYYTDKAVTLTNATTGAWYTSYVNYAIAKGIITANQFEGHYNDYVTRAEYAMIFAKALPDDAYNMVNVVQNNAIPDVKMTDVPYADAVYKLYRAGIVNGSGSSGKLYYFLPSTNIKRREVAAIINRMMNEDARITNLNLG